MKKCLLLFVAVFNIIYTLKSDTLTLRRTGIQVFAGPSLLFDNFGLLSGSAGIRLHSDLNADFFAEISHQQFLKASYSGEEMLFSNQPFTPAKFVSYKQSVQYAMTGIQFGYYWLGWGDDPSHAYFLMGANVLQSKHTFKAEEFNRSEYESFPENQSKTFNYISWNLGLGYQSLIGNHVGIFEELQLNFSLNANNTAPFGQIITYPNGHFIGLNFGFRFYLFSQKELLE